jgi:hypothetical protein
MIIGFFSWIATVLVGNKKRRPATAAPQSVQSVQSTESPSTVCVSGISEARVQEFVRNIMSDPRVDIAVVPNRFERALYAKAVRMILVIMERVCSEARLEVLGHTITLHVRPTAR